MEVKHTLIEFLEDQLPTFRNPSGVQLYLNTDSSLYLCADYPGIEKSPDFNLELVQEFKSLKNFLTVMGLLQIEQLLKLTPEDLLGLYDRGKMNILCSLEGEIDWEMTFGKYKKNLWARDVHEKTHQVKTTISQAEHFIDYTIAYYAVITN